MPNKKAFLLAVGVDHYAKHKNLRHCSKDSEDMCDCLRQTYGDDFGSIVLNSKQNEPSPTHQNFENQLGHLKSKSFGPDDTLYFYFSGHGFERSGQDYLVLSDSSATDLRDYIKTDDLIGKLKETFARNIIVIIDACRKDTSKGENKFMAKSIEIVQRNLITGFFGCSPGEICSEIDTDEINNGLFTYYLIDYIKNHNRNSPAEIDTNVRNKIGYYCESHPEVDQQTPYTVVMPVSKAHIDIFTQIRHDITQAGKRCFIIVGPTNTGKTSLGQYIKSNHKFEHIEMSAYAAKEYYDHIRKEAYKGSIQDYMENVVFATNEGKNKIARAVLNDVADLDKIVITGPRTPEEIDTFIDQKWEIEMYYLYSNSHERFLRQEKTGDTDANLSYVDIVKRDYQEYSWGLSKIPLMKSIEFKLNEKTLEDIYQEVVNSSKILE